jgi:hypothetical protein
VPKLHPITGLAACGTAGGRVSYGSRSGEQFVLCDGGCTFWLNADEIAFLGPLSGSWEGTPAGTAPQAVNIHTGARRPLEAVPAGVPLREASFLAATPAGRWQAAIAGAGASFGSCGEFPGGTVGRAMTDGRGAAAHDGAIVLVDVYQGGGQGFRISRPDGVIVPTFNPPEDREPAIAAGSDPYHLELVDQGRAIWPAAGAWGVHGITPAPLWIPGSLRACYVEIGGVAYLVHWLEGVGTVARRADSDQGKVLSRAGAEFHYDAIAWNGGIRIAWARFDGEPPGSLEIVEWDLVSGIEDLTPPAPIKFPTFRFSHPVSVYPFRAEGSGRPDVFTLGTYSESPTPTSPLPKGRLLLAHDSAADWTIPAGALRSYDAVGWELYRVEGETLEQSGARWIRQARANLAQWPRDCFVIPMFYNQFNPATGAWLWTDQEVLDGLEYLDQVVNLDPRIKFMAPFSFDRTNGIKPNPNLRRAFDDCVAAAARAGEATLTPVPTDPPIDPPIDPPHPPQPRKLSKGLKMEIDGKVVQLRGAGLRLIAPDAPGTGIWGVLDGKPSEWRGVLYVTDGASAARYRAKKIPGDRYTFTNVEAECLAGADLGQYSAGLDKQGYHKPTGNTDAGDLEQWRVYEGNEIGTIQAQIEQTSDANHPAGAGKKIVGFPLTVEIVS